MNETALRAPSVTDVQLDGVFWKHYGLPKLEALMKHSHDAMENRMFFDIGAGTLYNLRILSGKIEGRPYDIQGKDSNFAKWFEGLCYYYARHPQPKWREVIDEIADMMVVAQAEDGYFHTFFQLGAHPRLKRLEDIRETHELYTMGHLIEACIAHELAIGNGQLLAVACKIGDFLVNTFGPEEGKNHGYDGHQEVEIALVRLYQVTKKKEYLDLAKHFLISRGTEPLFWPMEARQRGYTGFWKERVDEFPDREIMMQSHLPLREQFTAEGHAVRAVYMYTAMADVAYETRDELLLEQCRRLWDNIVTKRMYITGGVGSLNEGEAFGPDYSLPNKCHAETCAAIGMIYFAQRMFHIEKDAKYLDVLERILYNNMLGSTSMDGEKYFYINVLARFPKEWNVGHCAVRDYWQGCACCPTNIARFFPSMNTYVYSYDEENLYVNLYAQGTGKFNLGDKEVTLTQQTDFPWKGDVKITVDADAEFSLHLRIPAYVKGAAATLNGQPLDLSKVEKGLLTVTRRWVKGDTVTLSLPLKAEVVKPHPYIQELRGTLAIMRGPIVYCLEEADNGHDLLNLSISPDAELVEKEELNFLYGGVNIYVDGVRATGESFGDNLYGNMDYSYTPQRLRFIPYYMWDNRGNGEMIVWTPQTL